MKDYLVILRCGDKSLHRDWYASGVEAGFDLALSYYGSDERFQDVRAQVVHRFKGSKWEGLSDFLRTHADLVSQYRYVWLPDDDLATDVSTIGAFFRYIEAEGFALAQPSLTTNSYYSYAATLQNKAFDYREMNFVEVMAPCFSKQALSRVADTFSLSKSGWGLDYVWPQKVKDLGRVGIVDRFAVFHTRPIGSAGSGMGGAAKIATPQDELRETLNRYGLKMSVKIHRATLKDRAAILESGSQGNMSLFWHSLKGSAAPRRMNPRTHARLLKEHLPWL